MTATNGEVARGGTDEQPFQLDTPVLKDTTTGESRYFFFRCPLLTYVASKILVALRFSPARLTSRHR